MICLYKQFCILKQKWYDDTKYQSLLNKIINHQAYLDLLDLGHENENEVISLILYRF